MRKTILMTAVLFLIFTFAGCTPQSHVQLPPDVKKIGFVSAAYELRMHTNDSDSMFDYNHNQQGYVSELVDDERQILNESLSSIDRVVSRKFSVQLVGLQYTPISESFLLPFDEHLYIPKGYSNVDILNPKVAEVLCRELGVNYLLSVRFVFVRYKYPDFSRMLDGKMNKIRIQMQVRLVDNQGHEVLSQSGWGESTTALCEGDSLNMFRGKEISRDLRNYYTLQSDFGPLFREALLDLIAKIGKE